MISRRITPLEAIRAFTINAVYASFEENIKGSIEPGKLVDLAVLDRDPCAVDPWQIRDIRVERTIIGGEVVICMERRRAVTTRTHEQKLLATTRIGTMEKELLADVARGFRFVGQTVFVNWTGGSEYVAILERPVP